MIVRGLTYSPTFDALYLWYPWIYDFVNLSRPLILVGMCEQIRISVFRLKKSTFRHSVGTLIATVTILS